jgi:hypothetical protein
VAVAEFVEQVADHVALLRKANIDRDARMTSAFLVINGYASRVFKGLFPSDWPQPVVHNVIKSSMEDTAMMVGVLPTLSAADASLLDESKRSRSDKLSRIINVIAYQSSLGTGLVTAAARMAAYGFVPLRVEPDFDESRPHIHVDDSMGAYYERDRFGRMRSYSRVFRKRASELVALYPEHESIIRKQTAWGQGQADEWLEVIRHYTDDETVLFVPARKGLVLERVENRLGRVPVEIAQLSTLDGEVHGAFDDALWVFAAKARLALLNLEAATKAVEAPIAVPSDVEEFTFGPDALLRSNNPQGIRRVSLEVPNSAVFEMRQLDEELKLASHYPDVRAGQTDASVVTGRGVQALLGGFDQRVKGAQVQLGSAVANTLTIALEMDKAYFGTASKKVSASVNGSSFEMTYTPDKDIYNTHVSAEYGVMAGLDPSRALVWSLQALGANLVSEAFVRRNLPVNINATEEEKLIDVEGLRKATMAAVQGYAQAIPQLATAGQDPMQVINSITKVIEARKKGVPIEIAAQEAFAPPEPDPAEAEQMAGMEQMMAMAGGGGDPMAAAAGGPMPGGPGGMPGGAEITPEYQPPAMAQLLAQLSGTGEPRTSVRTVRQRVI